MIVAPKLVALDTATLGNAARDYWSSDKSARDRVHDFVSSLQDQGVLVAITLTHVLELLALESASDRSDRFHFLRTLPLIAWLRPYDGQWFTGDMVSISQREMHAVKHDQIISWPDVIESVRESAWETGTGKEMFVPGNEVWDFVTEYASQHCRDRIEVASIVRTDAGNIKDATVGELKGLPRRTRDEQKAFLKQFAAVMVGQLKSHGDERVDRCQEIASASAVDTYRRIEAFANDDVDDIEYAIVEAIGIPRSLINDSTTVGEIGDLAVTKERYESLGETLKPPCEVTLSNTPPDALPSLSLHNDLSSIQQKADRVSGSDMGDANIAGIAWYVDHAEVDKRTWHNMEILCKKNARYADAKARMFYAGNRYDRILASIQ